MKDYIVTARFFTEKKYLVKANSIPEACERLERLLEAGGPKIAAAGQIEQTDVLDEVKDAEEIAGGLSCLGLIKGMTTDTNHI